MRSRNQFDPRLLSARIRAGLLLLGLGAAALVLTASAPATAGPNIEIPPEDPLGEVQDVVSDVVDTVTTMTCELTDIPQVCALNILAYEVRTDYKRPDNTHVVRRTGGVINLPTVIDVNKDLLPDLLVTLSALSPTNVTMKMERTIFAPALMPLQAEVLLKDPSTEGRLINIGYDTLATTAPTRWTAKASILTGVSLSVNAALGVVGAPSSMSVLGGVFFPGTGEERVHPKQARLTYTPVPASSTVAFSLEKKQTTGLVSTLTPSTAELDLRLFTGADGEDGQHINVTLNKLNKPVGLLLDKVDGDGVQTDGTTGDTHVRVTTQKDVAQAGLLYESFTDKQILKRVRIAAGPLPGQTDVTQTADGVLVDTDAPIALVAGGVASGKPAFLWLPTVPVPPEAPVESPWASYVHSDSKAGVDSTTFRVAGVEFVDVSTTGPQDNRRIEIRARLASAPLNVRVTNDAEPGGTLYDIDVKDLPHNLKFAFAANQTRMLEFCGSSNDAENPCDAEGQAAPAGIDTVVIKPSHAPKVFGEVTHLNGLITGLPSTLDLDVDTHVPVADDPDQSTKVHIEASRAIGHVTLRATDGKTFALDPADNGVVYLDKDDQYAVIAKIDGFRWAFLDIDDPKLALDLRAAGGHNFSFSVDLPTEDGPLHADGALPQRPARTEFALAAPKGGTTFVTVSGATSGGLLVPTPKVIFNLAKPAGIFGEVTNLHANVTDIPSPVTLTINADKPQDDNDPNQDTTVYIGADKAIGHVLLRAHDGSGAPADPADNGVVYRDTDEKYAVVAKIDGFRTANLESRPESELVVFVNAAGGHTFRFDAVLPEADGQLTTTGSLPNRPAQTYFALKKVATTTTITVSGWDADNTLTPTPKVFFNLQRPKAIFGDHATHLQAEVSDIPSPVTVTIDAVTPGPNDADQHSKVHIDADKAIGQVILRATDGSLPPADPADNGVVYLEPGDQYAVVAKVDGFRTARLDSAPGPDLTLLLRAEEGHDFSYRVRKATEAGLVNASGVLDNRPYQTDFDLQTLAKGVMTVRISGSTSGNPQVPVPTERVTLDLENPEDIVGKARFLHLDVQDIQPETLVTIDTITDPELHVSVTATKPIGKVLLRATKHASGFPPAPQDNGVIYQDHANKAYALIAKVDGFESVNLDMTTLTDDKDVTTKVLEAALLTAPGHDFSYAIHLPAKGGALSRDFTGAVTDRPARTAFSFETNDLGLMKVHVEGATKGGAPKGTPKISLDAHISDDAKDRLHNVEVDLTGVPSEMDLVKQPGDPITLSGLDLDVHTTDGPVELAELELNNGENKIPQDDVEFEPGGGGLLVFVHDGPDEEPNEFPDDDVFYLKGRVENLVGVSFNSKPTLDAELELADVMEKFRLYVNLGKGPDHKINVNECDDWNPAEHNGAHVEIHDVVVRNLQRKTGFHYDAGVVDACEKKAWRTVEYSADGNADFISYQTNAGDLAFLHAETGKTYDDEGNVVSPLPVPRDIKICQATNKQCYDNIGYFHQCTILGVPRSFCSTHRADATLYAETFGELARIDVRACLVNKNPSNFADCTDAGVQKGVFADLYTARVDVGYRFIALEGIVALGGFWAANTQGFGPNVGVNGRVHYVNHIKGKVLEHANLNFGWHGPRWAPTANSRFNKYFLAYEELLPKFSSMSGEAQCVDSDLGPELEKETSWLNFTIHDDPDAIGLIKTGMLCGFE